MVRIPAREKGVLPGNGVGIALHEGAGEDVEETGGDDPHDEDDAVVSGVSRPVDTLSVASHASSTVAPHEAALPRMEDPALGSLTTGLLLLLLLRPLPPPLSERRAILVAHSDISPVGAPLSHLLGASATPGSCAPSFAASATWLTCRGGFVAVGEEVVAPRCGDFAVMVAFEVVEVVAPFPAVVADAALPRAATACWPRFAARWVFTAHDTCSPAFAPPALAITAAESAAGSAAAGIGDDGLIVVTLAARAGTAEGHVTATVTGSGVATAFGNFAAVAAKGAAGLAALAAGGGATEGDAATDNGDIARLTGFADLAAIPRGASRWFCALTRPRRCNPGVEVAGLERPPFAELEVVQAGSGSVNKSSEQLVP